LPSASFSNDAGGSNEYRIGLGDKLSISVWENPNLSVTTLVRPDGRISYFLVDDLSVEGRTALEVKAVLTEKLRPFVSDPEVTVIVVEIDSIDLYVLGEVVNPGRYSLRKHVSLLHLLSLAGGVKKSADLDEAFVLRGNQKLNIDFRRLLHENDITHNITLQGYDLLYFPDNLDKGITVMGEINTPGTIPYREGMSLIEVIMQSGGLNKHANASKIKVVRGDKIITVDFKTILKSGDMASNIRMLPNDVVIVPESFL
jgi:polysaccharide export outer membrane protein